MSNPSHLKYTKEHEWIDVSDDIVTIGITDWAQSELGDIVFVELPHVGDTIGASDSFGTIEAVKAVSELYAPVSGEIIEINSVLESDPTVINSSPFEDGWMIKIKFSNASELEELLDHAQYGELTV